MAWPLAIVLYGCLKAVYRPTRRLRLFGWLPLRTYLVSISGFSFRHVYNIAFDHLVAPHALYLRRDEYAAWFEGAGLEQIELSWRNENSWRGSGQRTRRDAAQSLVAP